MAQTLDDLDRALAEADGLLGAADDDLDSVLAEADRLLAAPDPRPSTQGPSRRATPPAVPAPPVPPRASGRPAPAPRAPSLLGVERGGRLTLPGGASATDLAVIESSPAQQSLRQPDPFARRPQAPPPSDTLGAPDVSLPARAVGGAMNLGQAAIDAVPATAKGFVSGTMGTAASVAGTVASATYAKTPEEARLLSLPAAKARADFAPSPEYSADIFDQPGVMLDPRFWGYMTGQLAGSVASLAGTGAGGRVVGAAAASKLSARAPALASKLAQLGGPGAATAGESLVEAADAYQTVLGDGKSPQEAAEAAARVFSANAALLGLTNHPLFEAGGRGFRQVLKRAVTEGGQEAGQTMAANVATDRPLSEGVGTAALMGAVGGPVVGALLDGPRDRADGSIAPPAPGSETPGPVPAPSVADRIRAAIEESRAAREASSFEATPAAAGAPSADLDVVLAEADAVLAQEDAAPPAPPVVPPLPAEPAPENNAATDTAPPVVVAPPAPVDNPAPPAQTVADVAAGSDLDAGAGAEGRAARRRAADFRPQGRAQRDAHLGTVFADVLADARELDPAVDDTAVRREFDARVQLHEELNAEARQAGADPRDLLREIARLGGIDELDNGKGYHGELQRLREGQGGAVAGIKGVFRRRQYDDRGAPAVGLPLDVMLQRLQQDPRWQHLEDLDDIVDIIDDVQRGNFTALDVLPGYDRAVRELGMRPGERWWDDPIFPPDVTGATVDETVTGDGLDAAVNEADVVLGETVDDSFDPADLETVVAEADQVLEEQARPPLNFATGAIKKVTPGGPLTDASPLMEAIGRFSENLYKAAERGHVTLEQFNYAQEAIEQVDEALGQRTHVTEAEFEEWDRRLTDIAKSFTGPTTDTLDTGEQQTRLPGEVGAVRDEERAQPRETLPPQTLQLTSESAPADQPSLDDVVREADAVLAEDEPAPDNPFTPRLAKARAALARLSPTTARDAQMAQSFPLGPGVGRGDNARRIDQSVSTAVQITKLTQQVRMLEAQERAFAAGRINRQGRPVSKKPAPARRAPKADDDVAPMASSGGATPAKQGMRAAQPPARGGSLRTTGPARPAPGTKTLAATPKNARPSDLVRDMAKLFNVPVGVGRLGGKYWGWYHRKAHLIRTKIANDLPVLMHEFGHAAERHLALPLATPAYGAELARLGRPTSLQSYTAKQVREEGLAEFFRLWVLDPTTARAMAPAFYAAVEGRLDAMGDLGRGLRDLQKRAGAYVAADPETRVALRIDFDGAGTADIDSWMERAQVRWTDRLYWLQRATEAMAGGNPIAPAKHAYLLARIAEGSVARASDFLEHGVRDWSGRFIGPSLRAALRPVAKDLIRFATYLVAKRAIELQDRRIETGITRAEALGFVQEIERGPDAARFTTARDGVYAFQTAMLNYAREAGLLTAEQQRAIQQLNQAYVPFKRVMDRDSGGSGTSRKIADRLSPIKKIKGSGRDIINPLESIIGNAYQIVDAAEKNRAMQALAAQADKADDRKKPGTGSGQWLRRIQDPQQVTGVKLGDALLEASKRAGATVLTPTGQSIDPALEQMLQALGIDPDDVLPVFGTAFTGPKGEHIITVLKDGKRQFYQVEHDGLYEALTQVATAAPDAVKVFQLATQILRAGATLTTGFIARNPARDTLSAFLQSRHGFIPLYDTIRGGIKAVLHDLGVRNDDEVALFYSQGITQATLVGVDRKTLRGKIRQVADPARHIATVVMNPLEFLQALSAYSEVATRVGEFSLALRQGGERHNVWQRVLSNRRQPVNDNTLAAAALAARDVTTDFSRAGTMARHVNQYAAFFNARVQGYVRIVETIRTQPKTAAFNVTALMLAAIVFKALNEDDDDYNELAEWEKLAYWHWRPPGADFFVRIPKPFEWAFAPNMAEAAVDWARGRDEEPWKLVKAQIHDNARQFTLGLLPTLLLPTLEASANYSLFRQRNIVNPWDLDLPLEQQAGDWTTETAKLLTRLGLPLAPAKIDHWLFGHTAGLGRSAVQGLADPALRAVGAAPPAAVQPAKRWEDTPFIGAYLRSAAPKSDAESIVEFYTAFREMEGTRRGYNKAKADPAQQGRILDGVKRQRWRGREDEMKAAKKTIDDIADEIDKVYADPSMTPQQKTTSLEGMRRALVYEARVGLGYESTDHVRRRAPR